MTRRVFMKIAAAMAGWVLSATPLAGKFVDTEVLEPKANKNGNMITFIYKHGESEWRIVRHAIQCCDIRMGLGGGEWVPVQDVDVEIDMSELNESLACSIRIC